MIFGQLKSLHKKLILINDKNEQFIYYYRYIGVYNIEELFLRISYKIRAGIIITGLLIGFYATTATGSVYATEVAAVQKGMILSLDDCIEIALKNSPSIKKSRYNYRLSKTDVTIAKASYFPTLGIGASFNFRDSHTNRQNTSSNYYSAEASVNQLIWNFGKTNSKIRMQKFNQIASQFNFDNTVLSTIYTVKNNYYGVLAAKATVDVNRANVQINERNYQRTKAYFDEGIKSRIDLVNAEVYLSDSKVTLVQSEKTYKNAIVKLNNSMYIAYAPDYEIKNTETFNFKRNEIPVNLAKISEKKDISNLPESVSDATLTSSVEKLNVMENFNFKPFPYTFEKSVELAIENRPDLKAYENTLKAMKQSLLYIKREYYPEISGSVGYGWRDTNSTNSLNVGINAKSTVNIMSKKAEIDAGKIQVELAQNEIDLLKQNIYFEVQNAYINMVQLEKQIPLLAIKVKQTLENLELADGRYYVGIGDYIELQDAKVNYNNAQQAYVEAVYNYNVARATLEQAIALKPDIKITIEDKD